MGRFRVWLIRRLLTKNSIYDYKIPSFRKNIPNEVSSASKSSSTSIREGITGIVKRLGFRLGDTSSDDFEESEFDLSVIMEGCKVDSYLRQGVDKFVDQIFKEGFGFYGKDENIVAYVTQRLQYMAEATDTPLETFLTEISEDVVKYSNSITVKSRTNDPNAFPPGVSVNGINGKDPVGGYFSLNPTTMKVKRDENGTITGWQQEADEGGDTVEFDADDVVHIYYKREKGNAFGTPFLLPVINDIRSLRETEDNVLKMLYKNIYPFLHVKVGTSDKPGTKTEIDDVQESLEDMDLEGGLVTSSIVDIDAVETNKVIDAEPYLRYMEDRVFSGMGIPAIMFGRGETANRNTGDNMANEMSDRVKAFQKVIETNINFKIVKEILYEGGYDPILNPEHVVEFKFNNSDVDAQIKSETHAIYKYEHNAITEDEMRNALGMDPITDRSTMHQTLITQANAEHAASLSSNESQTSSSSTKKENNKQKETDNKQTPTNQHGTKTSPKKTTNSEKSKFNIYDFKDDILKSINKEDGFNNLKDTILSYKDLLITNDNLTESAVKNKLLNLFLVINDVSEQLDDKALVKDIIDTYIDNSFSDFLC